MLAFGFGRQTDERFTYRGYALEISKDPTGWRLGIYPSRPELPILSPILARMMLSLRLVNG